jgi:hypothetical protein
MLNDRLSWLATVATVTVMFVAIVWLAPLLQAQGSTFVFGGSIAAALASLGVYRLLAIGLVWAFGTSQWLRRRILGNGFLEGTWVGHYAHQGQHRFTIEYFDQTSGATVVHGREFDAQGKTRASWSSDTVSVDTNRLQLIYAYTCKVFDQKHVQEGLGVFAIIREKSGPATKLDGYSVDLIDGDRDPNTEHKISESPVSDDQALKEARRIFSIP